VLAAAFLLPSCRFGAPGGDSVQGRDIANLYHLFFWVAIGVGGTVYALILFSVVRYRRRDDRLPRQTRYHVPLEITYTVVPVVIVLALFVVTFRTERRVDATVDDPAVVVNVTGFQWQWRFDYPGSGVSIVGTPRRAPTMVVPAGRTVHVNLRAQDVIHAFYVPRFLFKRDAIPGVRNRFDLLVPRVGRYRGECAEYCGLNHAYMEFWVQAVPPAQFRRWLAERRG
jgi:cytochrome c oxidase subunit II